MIEIRTLQIERDWFSIVQDRQQWSTIWEWIYLPDNIVEVCVANRFSQQQAFSCTCGHTFKHSEDRMHLDK